MTNITVAPDGATITLINNNQTFTSELSLRSQRARLGGARWGVSLMWTNRKGRDAAKLAAELAGLEGDIGEFSIAVPEYSRFGSVTTNGTVVSAPLDSNTITVSGFGANQPEAFAAGDWVEINKQCYKVTVDAATDGAGQAVLNVAPRVRRVPSVGATVNVLAPRMHLRMSDSNGLSFALGAATGSPIYALSIEATEID